MRKVVAALAAVTVGAALAVPALAITDGELDGNGHPFVGLMVAQDASGNPLWRCSGTLLSPTVFLTAGHCTEGAAHVEIWFAADVDAGRPGNGYPFDGEVGGTPYVHPDYNTSAFVLRDVGVVVLDTEVPLSHYGELPTLNQLDRLKVQRGKQDVTFRAVGYGLQKSFPDAASWQTVAKRVRMVSYPKLNQINVPGFTGDFSLLLSNNASTGGTCFGDSGGPNFLGSSNVVAGVTSFGINGNCAGTGGVFRMDRSWSLDWVSSFLD
jgi:V8-like Glu-specific endopeptidase